MTRLAGKALLAAAALLLATSAADAVQVKESHPLLGALVDITVDGADRDDLHERIREAVGLAHRIEAELDPLREESEIARLNAGAGSSPLHLSVDVFRLLALSQLMTRSTGGVFDVTVGPLLRRLSTSPSLRGGRLDAAEALNLVGSDKLVLHPPDAVELVDVGMSLDVRAIAEGYLLERMAASLRAGGVVRGLLEFGDSTILAIGPPEGEEPWRVWIARGKSTIGSLALRDAAASTSRALARRSDKSRAAIVDPRSGRIVESDRQATVVARNAAIANAWSTALVVDPDGALDLLDEPRDVEALVFDEHGEHASPRFGSYSGWKAGRKNTTAAGGGAAVEGPPPAEAGGE